MRHVAAGSPLTEVGRGRTDLASLASEDPGSGSVLQVEIEPRMQLFASVPRTLMPPSRLSFSLQKQLVEDN